MKSNVFLVTFICSFVALFSLVYSISILSSEVLSLEAEVDDLSLLIPSGGLFITGNAINSVPTPGLTPSCGPEGEIVTDDLDADEVIEVDGRNLLFMEEIAGSLILRVYDLGDDQEPLTTDDGGLVLDITPQIPERLIDADLQGRHLVFLTALVNPGNVIVYPYSYDLGPDMVAGTFDDQGPTLLSPGGMGYTLAAKISVNDGLVVIGDSTGVSFCDISNCGPGSPGLDHISVTDLFGYSWDYSFASGPYFGVKFGGAERLYVNIWYTGSPTVRSVIEVDPNTRQITNAIPNSRVNDASEIMLLAQSYLADKYYLFIAPFIGNYAEEVPVPQGFYAKFMGGGLGTPQGLFGILKHKDLGGNPISFVGTSNGVEALVEDTWGPIAGDSGPQGTFVYYGKTYLFTQPHNNNLYFRECILA